MRNSEAPLTDSMCNPPGFHCLEMNSFKRATVSMKRGHLQQMAWHAAWVLFTRAASGGTAAWLSGRHTDLVLWEGQIFASLFY